MDDAAAAAATAATVDMATAATVNIQSVDIVGIVVGGGVRVFRRTVWVEALGAFVGVCCVCVAALVGMG
eukprot:m.278283 g.278283  ORF g.278283 m.278283 type:complete len:69 (+) comp26943_c0_seq2:2304-2510(+)